MQFYNPGHFIKLALEQEPKRINHGETKDTGFFISNGQIYSYKDYLALNIADPKAILVHSHHGHNGESEIYPTFSLTDLRNLQDMLSGGYGSSIIVFGKEDYDELIATPDGALLRLEKLGFPAEEEPVKELMDGITNYDIYRAELRDYARENGLLYQTYVSWAEKAEVIRYRGNGIQKSVNKMTRADAKKVHKDLPEGGIWRTMNGHHIYIKDGKVLAGAVPGTKGAKKATKAQLKEHQENLSKTSEKPKKSSESIPKSSEKSKKKPEVSTVKKPKKGKKVLEVKPSEDISKISHREIQERLNKLEAEAHKNIYSKYDSKAVKDQLMELKAQRAEASTWRKSKKKTAELERIDNEVSKIRAFEANIYSEAEKAKQDIRTNHPLGKELRKRNELAEREHTGNLLPDEEKTLNKEVGAGEFNPKAPKEYFYRSNYKGEWGKRAVQGIPVDLGYGLDGFITHSDDNREFAVHLAKSGQQANAVSFSNNYLEAEASEQSTKELLRRVVNATKVKLRKLVNGTEHQPGIGKKGLQERVNAQVEKNGISPRYADDGKVKADKQQIKEKKEPKKKKDSEYYIQSRKVHGQDKGSVIWQKVDGTKVKIPGYEKHDLFVHKSSSDKYVISEGKSGMKIAEADKKEWAIKSAKEVLDNAGDMFTKRVNEVIKNNISPRHGGKIE
jgi:hypothetical protein